MMGCPCHVSIEQGMCCRTSLCEVAKAVVLLCASGPPAQMVRGLADICKEGGSGGSSMAERRGWRGLGWGAGQAEGVYQILSLLPWFYLTHLSLDLAGIDSRRLTDGQSAYQEVSKTHIFIYVIWAIWLPPSTVCKLLFSCCSAVYSEKRHEDQLFGGK